jgi:arylsulfatase A-like enzyme
VLKTPNLDALAADGVTFLRHYTQAAPCGPSRASLLTGMYMMNHRSVRNGTPLDPRFTNIALEMRKLGYDSSLIGYTDTSADPRGLPENDPALQTYSGTLPGFKQLVPGSEGEAAWSADLAAKGYDIPNEKLAVYRPRDGAAGGWGPTFAPARYTAEDSETAFLTNAAARFIARQKKPWFLHLSLLRPHPPFICPEPYNSMYDPATVPGFVGRESRDAEAELHPYIAYMMRDFRDQFRDGHRPAFPHPAEDRAKRQLRATYYGLMSKVDHFLGRLFAMLKASGVYDDTLIVFTTDHGEQLWDHWALGKEFFFDQSFHIPLIVRAPGKAADAARGRKVDEFSEAIDVMPTILDLLGGERPVQCDGASLKPWLQGDTPQHWRQQVFFELDFRDIKSGAPEQEMGLALDECALAVVRDRTHKYVHFAALPPLLFDLSRGAQETVNLMDDPTHAPHALRLAQKLLSWRLAHAERSLTGYRLGEGGLLTASPERRIGA